MQPVLEKLKFSTRVIVLWTQRTSLLSIFNYPYLLKAKIKSPPSRQQSRILTSFLGWIDTENWSWTSSAYPWHQMTKLQINYLKCFMLSNKMEVCKALGPECQIGNPLQFLLWFISQKGSESTMSSISNPARRTLWLNSAERTHTIALPLSGAQNPLGRPKIFAS